MTCYTKTVNYTNFSGTEGVYGFVVQNCNIIDFRSNEPYIIKYIYFLFMYDAMFCGKTCLNKSYRPF